MVTRTISATEARVHFGKLMRSVVENDQPVIVERAGKPEVVVLAVDKYQRMKAAEQRESWKSTFKRIQEIGDAIRMRREDVPLPDPAEVIHQMREERSEQLLDALR
jgi:prevent-host-death family protein